MHTNFFWWEFRVSLHILRIPLRISGVVISWSHSEGVDEVNIFPGSLFLFCPHEALYFEYPVMLHAIFPLYFTVIPCVCWLAVECGYCRIEGEGDEAAFNQQLAPHKAFITPKRLRLPKPEWDKHCPFICNDVEARSNWTELRGKG